MAPKLLRPPKPPPPPPPPLVACVPARGIWRWTRTGKVARTRIWAPWYLFGILAIVTHPRERWSWGGTR